MITLDNLGVRLSLFNTIINWFDFIENHYAEAPHSKLAFDSAFQVRLRRDPVINANLYDRGLITMMTSPTYNNLYSDLWVSASDQNHSFVTVNLASPLEK